MTLRQAALLIDAARNAQECTFSPCLEARSGEASNDGGGGDARGSRGSHGSRSSRAGDDALGDGGGGTIVHERLYDKEKIERKAQHHKKNKVMSQWPNRLPPPVCRSKSRLSPDRVPACMLLVRLA